MIVSENAILTIKQAAIRAGVGTQKIRRDIDNGSLKAYKVGWVWLINERDFMRYVSRGSEENINI